MVQSLICNLLEILPVHNTTQYLYLIYNFGNFISVNGNIPRATKIL